MSIKKVILIGDPLLRKKCVKVNNFNSPDVKTIKSGLRSSLYHLKKFNEKGSELRRRLLATPLHHFSKIFNHN